MTETAETKPVRPPSMDTVTDGILHGKVIQKKEDCEHCGVGTRCIEIYEVSLPSGIDDHSTILHKVAADGQSGHIINLIGVGCGCYAKFHRQVAHIQEKQTMRLLQERKKAKKAKKDKKKGR